MQHHKYQLELPASVAAGAAQQRVGELMSKAVFISGTFSATFQVQVKVVGGDWINCGTALTAPGVVELPDACTDVRISTTSFTSFGTGSTAPVAILAGLNHRSE